jgi:hypothetical protein
MLAHPYTVIKRLSIGMLCVMLLCLALTSPLRNRADSIGIQTGWVFSSKGSYGLAKPYGIEYTHHTSGSNNVHNVTYKAKQPLKVLFGGFQPVLFHSEYFRRSSIFNIYSYCSFITERPGYYLFLFRYTLF